MIFAYRASSSSKIKLYLQIMTMMQMNLHVIIFRNNSDYIYTDQLSGISIVKRPSTMVCSLFCSFYIEVQTLVNKIKIKSLLLS